MSIKCEIEYIQLQDLTAGMALPCVLDVKLGVTRPRENHVQVATTSGTMKFRLCGMSARQAKTGAVVFRNKYWGRRVTDEAIKESFTLFLFDGNFVGFRYRAGEKVNKEVGKAFLESVRGIRAALSECKGIKFYSTSLLLVYDGATETTQEPVTKLIDFGHSVILDSKVVDNDALEGIDNFCKAFEKVIA